MINLKVLLVLISTLAPTNLSFLFFEFGLVTTQIFLYVPVSNLTIISHNAIFWDQLFSLTL